MTSTQLCTCYFCFHKFHASEVVRVCTICSMEVDATIEAVFGVRVKMPRRFEIERSSGPGEMGGEVLCPDGHPTTDLACPRCHADIELSASGSGEMLALVGATESGKSTFVGALLEHILNHPSRCFYDYGATLDKRSDKVFANLRRTMYQVHQFPEGTRIDRDLLPTPLVTKLALPPPSRSLIRNPWEWLFPPREQLVPLVFFDHPGERFSAMETPYVRYAAGAAGLMVAVDPTVLPGATPHADTARPSAYDANDATLDPNDLTRTVTDELRKTLGRRVEIDKPVALLILKADEIPALAPVLQDMEAARRRAGKSPTFDIRQVDAIDARCRELLDSWGGGATVSVLQKAFRDLRVFPVVSAWRRQGTATIDPSRLPLGIEEPLYWLLVQLGYFRI